MFFIYDFGSIYLLTESDSYKNLILRLTDHDIYSRMASVQMVLGVLKTLPLPIAFFKHPKETVLGTETLEIFFYSASKIIFS